MIGSKNGKVVAFIPVRGGSKSIPLKNIKPIAGKPLVQWVLEAASAASCIDEVVVATDSEQISATVKSLTLPKVRVVGRSVESATDAASTESALVEFCHESDCGSVFLIQATSPLLKSSDIEFAWQLYQKSEFRSVLSVVRQKRFIWDSADEVGIPANYDPQQRPRRQDFPGYLVENGALYLSSRADILRSKCRISSPVGLYEMGESSYYEIDEPSDWIIVEELLRCFEKRPLAKAAGQIRMFVMDCDGVLTDGGMYYSRAGEELKKFNTRDGKGIELLRKAGIKTVILTGENSESVLRRAEKLKIDEVVSGSIQKDQDLQALARKYNLSLSEIAYIGDDINDLPAIPHCGLTACPADANSLVQRAVDVVLDRKGGEGAVRAFVDMILGQ